MIFLASRCLAQLIGAVRLHAKLRLADFQPDLTEITEGKICERAAMRRMLKPGEFYLGDRNYGADHGLFHELDEVGCGYVLRMNNSTILEVVENYPISIGTDGKWRYFSAGSNAWFRVGIGLRKARRAFALL